MMKLPPQSEQILKALYYFHYLTAEQMVQLGISSKTHNLHAHGLAALAPKRNKNGVKATNSAKPRSKFFIDSLRYGRSIPGKLPYIFYMRQRGADYLHWICEDEIDEEEEIWFPTPKESLTNDYFHRIDYVSTHIYLRRWAQSAGVEIEFDQHDYQGIPGQKDQRGRPVSVNQLVYDPKTLKTAKPDGIFGVRYGDEPNAPHRIFIVELHNSTDTKKVIHQLHRNFRAIPALKAKFPDFPLTHEPTILSVHTNQSILKATKKRIKDHHAFENVQKGMAFALLNDLKTDFDTAWTHADNKTTTIFKEK